MENYKLIKPASVKTRRRVGRGTGSGLGKTCGRGENGQLSRAGSGHRPWFEGGQMPIQRRVPKRGFTNYLFKCEYQIVNLSQLEGLSGEVNSEVLLSKNLIKDKDLPVKVLGNGEIKSSITITADAFSSSAKEKIEKAGGKAVLITK